MKKIADNVMAKILAAVQENPDASVNALGTDGIFRYVSPSLTPILGWSQEEVLGHHFAEFFEADDVSHLNLVIQDLLLTGESIEYTRQAKLKTGGHRRMRGKARLITDDVSGEVYVLSIGFPIAT